jgi:hypothetical protein
MGTKQEQMLVNADGLGTGGARAYELAGTTTKLTETMQERLFFALPPTARPIDVGQRSAC